MPQFNKCESCNKYALKKLYAAQESARRGWHENHILKVEIEELKKQIQAQTHKRWVAVDKMLAMRKRARREASPNE